jgi:hypothetical protein
MSDDEVRLAALQAARFADSVRGQIDADLKSASPLVAPDFYAKLSGNLSTISNASINRLALPLMREQVSLADAQAALEFFSSPEGAAIANKLSASSFPKLSDAESASLEQFAKSASGMALYAFFGNPMVLPTVVDGICNYAP